MFSGRLAVEEGKPSNDTVEECLYPPAHINRNILYGATPSPGAAGPRLGVQRAKCLNVSNWLLTITFPASSHCDGPVNWLLTIRPQLPCTPGATTTAWEPAFGGLAMSGVEPPSEAGRVANRIWPFSILSDSIGLSSHVGLRNLFSLPEDYMLQKEG